MVKQMRAVFSMLKPPSVFMNPIEIEPESSAGGRTAQKVVEPKHCFQPNHLAEGRKKFQLEIPS